MVNTKFGVNMNMRFYSLTVLDFFEESKEWKEEDFEFITSSIEEINYKKVLSYNEIDSNIEIQSIGMVSVNEN